MQSGIDRVEIDVNTGEQSVISISLEETAAMIELEYLRVTAIPYKEKRMAEYPPVTDYIDGIVKGDQAQIDAYIAACLAVKAKYPKP